VKTQFTIAEECFDAVMDELSREVGKTLEKPPDTREEREAFLAFLGSLSTIAAKRFQYWPEEDKNDLESMCGTWMHVGILLGKSPKFLASILKRANARIERIEEHDDQDAKLR
jgi:hypothetical protein